MEHRDFGPRATHYHSVMLTLTDAEWDQLCSDARETGISPSQLVSLVVSFTCRAKINHAACLALHDITLPPAEYLAQVKAREAERSDSPLSEKGKD